MSRLIWTVRIGTASDLLCNQIQYYCLVVFFAPSCRDRYSMVQIYNHHRLQKKIKKTVVGLSLSSFSEVYNDMSCMFRGTVVATV